MNISRTQAQPRTSAPAAPSLAAKEVSEEATSSGETDQFVSSSERSLDGLSLLKAVAYGAAGGLTGAQPGIGLLTSAASLPVNMSRGNEIGTVASAVGTFLSLGNIAIGEGDLGLAPYIATGILGAVAWGSVGLSSARVEH